MLKTVTTNCGLAIDDRFVADVEEFLTDIENNQTKAARELSPEEFFNAYLTWNGIIGFDLWELAKQLLDPDETNLPYTD